MVGTVYVKITIMMILSALVVLPAIPAVHAQEGIAAEDVLGGFDEDEGDDALEGFDDEDALNDGDDALEGFDEAEEKTPEQHPVPEEKRQAGSRTDEADDPYKHWPSYLSPGGHLKTRASYNFAHDKPEEGETDWRGLSRLSLELMLEMGLKINDSWQAFVSGSGYYDLAYAIKGRNDFTEDVLDNYEKEAVLREAYLQGTLIKNLDMKLGRQIVVWGKSDYIRVTDVLNPLDLREPGVTDIEDLRLPLAMSRLDYYLGPWGLAGIAVHEIEFNKNPEFGSDFYPSTTRLPYEDKDLEKTEYAAALNGTFTGWDMALYWAEIYNDTPHAEVVSIDLLVLGPSVTAVPVLELKHARIKMYGATANLVLGNWILKAEAAYLKGLKFANRPEEKYSRIDIMGGIEYSGFTDTTISLEAVNRHIRDFDEILEEAPDEAQRDSFQWVFVFTRDFLNETLTTTFLASTFGGKGQDGSYQRLTIEYDITDDVKFTCGVILYQDGDLPQFRNISDNDRIFLELKYSF